MRLQFLEKPVSSFPGEALQASILVSSLWMPGISALLNHLDTTLLDLASLNAGALQARKTSLLHWLEVHLLKLHLRSDELDYSTAYTVSDPRFGADYVAEGQLGERSVQKASALPVTSILPKRSLYSLSMMVVTSGNFPLNSLVRLPSGVSVPWLCRA
jgi:hypothetical protein